MTRQTSVEDILDALVGLSFEDRMTVLECVVAGYIEAAPMPDGANALFLGNLAMTRSLLQMEQIRTSIGLS